MYECIDHDSCKKSSIYGQKFDTRGFSSDLAVVVEQVSKEFILHRKSSVDLDENFVGSNRENGYVGDDVGDRERGADIDKHRFLAIDDVSFTISKGTSCGLVGSNGSGKSTILKLLSGVYQPTRGSIHVSGKISTLSDLEAIFRSEATGRENLSSYVTSLGYSQAQVIQLIDKIIEFADIGDFIDLPAEEYSAGIYEHLRLATSVIVEPEILLIDETIATTDTEFQKRCFTYLKELKNSGVTVILATHSLSLAKKLCEQIIWIEQGRVQAIGSADKIASSYFPNVDMDSVIAIKIECALARERQALEQIALIRSSASWRLTAPLRAAKRFWPF